LTKIFPETVGGGVSIEKIFATIKEKAQIEISKVLFE